MGNAVFIVWRETIEAMLADRCSASPPAIAASAPGLTVALRPAMLTNH